jgi:hypothetical protein
MCIKLSDLLGKNYLNQLQSEKVRKSRVKKSKLSANQYVYTEKLQCTKQRSQAKSPHMYSSKIQKVSPEMKADQEKSLS